MKKLTILAMAALVMLAMASCKAPQQVAEQTSAFGKKIGEQMPCMPEADNESYFYETGDASHVNMANARRAALLEAQNMIYSRLGGAVESIVDNTFDDIRGQSKSSFTQSETKQAIEKKMKRMMNDAEKICEEIRQEDTGAFHAYIGVRISKEKLIQGVLETIDEVSQIKIDHEKYRKEFRERMNELNKK